MRLSYVILLGWIVIGAGCARGDTVLYVDANRASGQHDGSSWTNAYQNLQQALVRAHNDTSVREIWVAQGTYKPGSPGNRYTNFDLAKGVAMYGGFAGSELELSQRDFRSHVSILSGDLAGNDASGAYTDNTYRVVDASLSDANTVLDGFTITGGNADNTDGSYAQVGGGLFSQYGNAAIRNCTFTKNSSYYGGSAVLAHGSIMTFENCIFRDNTTQLGVDSGGGGILSRFGSDVTVINGLFIGNNADFGGGVDSWHGSIDLLNCTFRNNHAASSGGAVEVSYDPAGYPESASATLINTVLWGNTAADGGAQIAQTLGTNGVINVSYCDVQGGLPGVNMEGGGALLWDVATVLVSDPLFSDADGRLSVGSPAVDRGSNDAAYYPTDLDGLPRRTDGGSDASRVDMGAFELHAVCVPGTPPPAGMTLLDWDADGDVDRTDAEAFFDCLTGPGQSLPPGCRVFDVDNDCNIDLVDYEQLQRTVDRPPENPPALCVSPATLNFSGPTTDAAFMVWNCGGGTLSYTIAESASWITGLSATSGGSTGESDPVTVTVSRAGLADGRYESPITVTADGVGQQTINVVLYVGAAGGTMLTASRASGVAPLSVFFDALDPASTVVQPSDGDYPAWRYVWDFGDTAAGNWSTVGLSRNVAVGYVAAHVFDRPGTYPVTLTVTSPAGQVFTYQQDITVDDPAALSGWKTYYVAANGVDTNDGRTPVTPFKSFSKAMSLAGTSTRILFRRGDIFPVPLGVSISANGPGIVGAYGDIALARPVLQSKSLPFIFRPLKPHWRFMDLEMQGDATPSLYNSAIDGGAAATQYLLLERLKIQGYYTAVVWTYYPQPIVHDHDFIVDCEIFGSSNKGMFVGGTRQVVMGNSMHDSQSHVVRMWHGRKAIISDNRLLYSFDPVGAVIKLHNATEVSGLPDGEYIIISDNYIKGHTWDVTIGTQGGWANETVRNVVVERNFVAARSTTTIGIRVSAQNVIVRNNIGDLTEATLDSKFLSVARWGIEPPPTGARVCNNNVYRSNNGKGWLLEDTYNDTQTYNNLAWSASGQLVIGGNGGTFSNNLNSNPRWVNPSAGDFRLQSNSPAIDAGRVVTVTDDYLGNARPIDGNGAGGAQFDVGAVEYKP